MIDSQKQKVYDWEDSFWGWDRNLVTLKKCREVIRFAAGLYGIEPPSVRSHHKVEISYSIPQSREISLQSKGSQPGRGGLNYPTALHEVTHQIIWDYYGNTVEDHGPQFAGVYSWLLQKAGIAPGIFVSMDDADIRWQYLTPGRMPAKIALAPLVVGEADPKILVP